MTRAKSIALVALCFCLTMHTAAVFAGTVQVGLANDSEFSAWMCGGSMPPDMTQNQSSCGIAKFKKCSSCRTIVIQNESADVVNPEIEVTGPGFDHSDAGLLMEACSAGSGEKGGSAENSCYNLAPGHRCFASINFCPEQSGISQGRVKVTVGKGSEASVAIFPVVGEADYSPELQAAEDVRKRHLAELMAIPKVHRISLDQSDDQILIDVEVEQNADGSKTPDDIEEVRRQVPPTIEGYEVEVTEYVPVEYAL
ncbi:MAG: hypothetical protein ACREEA_06120 [Stellaceae bacterium]